MLLYFDLIVIVRNKEDYYVVDSHIVEVGFHW